MQGMKTLTADEAKGADCISQLSVFLWKHFVCIAQLCSLKAWSCTTRRKTSHRLTRQLLLLRVIMPVFRILHSVATRKCCVQATRRSSWPPPRLWRWRSGSPFWRSTASLLTPWVRLCDLWKSPFCAYVHLVQASWCWSRHWTWPPLRTPPWKRSWRSCRAKSCPALLKYRAHHNVLHLFVEASHCRLGVCCCAAARGRAPGNFLLSVR